MFSRKVPAPTGELVDGIDFSAMDAYMRFVLSVVQREGTTIARVFPPDADVLIDFADRIASDVVRHRS
jgi:recyclin-1